MNIVIIGGSRIVLIGSTSGIRRDRGGTFTETRKKSSEEDRSLLETSDLGKVIALTFRLSPQAVLEEVNIRPLDRKSTRLNSSHTDSSRMPSSA